MAASFNAPKPSAPFTNYRFAQPGKTPRRNANDVSGGKVPADAALNGAVTFFMWRDRLAIHQRATYDQRPRPGLYEKNVCLSFMPLDRAVSASMYQQETVMGVVR